MLTELPHLDWRCIAATPWLTAAAAPGRRALGQFLGTTWRLPSWVPQASGAHGLSPLLPPAAGLAGLLRALHGRLFVVNHLPVAAASAGEGAVARALVDRALAGTPAPWAAPPWTAAPSSGAASWPADSRAALAQMLAREWAAAQHDAPPDWGAVVAAAVALYEGPVTITTGRAGEAARGAGPPIARVGAVVPYQLAVVLHRGGGSGGAPPPLVGAGAGAGSDGLPTQAVAGPERGWFAGRVLLSDTAAVAAMDPATRHRWARVTGRAGGCDAYWFPDSWARFLEPGRLAGCVTPAQVGRTAPGRRAGRSAAGATFDPGVERGVCVPPGYALVDCVGTLATAVLTA